MSDPQHPETNPDPDTSAQAASAAVENGDADQFDDELVPEPAWVNQQREEQAREAAQQGKEQEAALIAGDEQPDQHVAGEDDLEEQKRAATASENGGRERPAAGEEDVEDQATPSLPDLPELPKPESPRIIAMINQKGGVGKTTTTVNLGAALASSGLRVLLIDLDPQAHLTLSLGIDPADLDLTLYDLLTDKSIAASQVVRIVENNPNLGVLPADTNLAGVESELAEMVQTGLAQTILRNKCADLFKQFDYILIDCPPSLGLLTINGLTAAREIIVPMQAHFLALQGMGKLFETINMIRQGINPQLQVSGVVLCMHEANTILASDVVADVKGFFEEARGTALPWANATVYEPPVRRNIKLAEAPSFGQSVLTYAADSNGAKDYANLARSVAGVSAE